MSWIDEQRESLVQKPSSPINLSGLFSGLFVVACAGAAVVGGWSLINNRSVTSGFSSVSSGLGEIYKDVKSLWEPHVVTASGLPSTKPEPPQAPGAGDTPMLRRLKDASAPSRPGVRVGTRARATFLTACSTALPSAGDKAGVGTSGRANLNPNSPEGFELRFEALEGMVAMGTIAAGAGAMSGSPYQKGPENAFRELLVVEHYSPVVACALARPAETMCNPDNRAAALTFLESYFDNYAIALEAVRIMEPKRKVEAQRLIPAYRHEQIERDLERHARMGSIRYSDIGWFPNERLKAIMKPHSSAPDICAGKTGK